MAVTAEVADLHQPLTDAEVETVLRPALDAVDPMRPASGDPADPKVAAG